MRTNGTTARRSAKLPFTASHLLRKITRQHPSVIAGLLAAAGTLPAPAPAATFGYNSTVSFAGEAVCPLDIIDTPELIKSKVGPPVAEQPIELEADQIDAPDTDTLVLTGNAEVLQGRQALFADSVTYNKAEYSVSTRGDVVLYTPTGDRIEADAMDLQLETRIGNAEKVQFQIARTGPDPDKRRMFDSDGGFFGSSDVEMWGTSESMFYEPEQDEEEVTEDKLPADGHVRARMRGEAERIFLEGHDRERLVGTRMTSCRIGQDSVYLNASEIVLDHASGIGIGKNMTVRFFRIPIFYFPRASFPITDERKTGFLFPSVGSSNRSGTIVEVPYYINIAPQMDATVIPKYLSDRGLQVLGEFRYLGENYDGIFRAEVLPSDDIYGDDRWAVGYDHDHNFTEQWSGSVDVQDVSDSDYFDDFSNDVNVSSASHLSQEARADYRGDIWDFSARARAYTTIDDLISKESQPYERLPQLQLDGESERDRDSLFRYELDSEVVNFDHPSQERVKGVRLNLVPAVEMPMERIYGFLTPRLELRHTRYQLDNTAPEDPDDPSFTVPVFSLDAGLFFERAMSWGGRAHTQTLEPRVYYVYAPEEEDQNDAPVFDTGGGNLNNISNFFRNNRFFGADRVGDANRLSVGVESRVIDDNDGRQRLKAAIAQIFYFDDREIQLNELDEPETADESDLLAEVLADVTESFHVSAATRYSHESSEVESVRAEVAYNPDRRRYLGIGYWYDRDSTEQVDLLAYWPLANRWQLGLDYRYSIETEEDLLTSVSIGYDACCWAARLSGQRRRIRTEDYETAVVLTLELKNLGAFSSGL